MADYTQGIDISRWQGNVDLQAVKNSGIEVVAIKVSGSDAGDYVDPQAGTNYAKAQAAGFIPVTYHFAGGTDPIHESEFFVNTCSPLDENQVLVLDWEVQHDDPVGWCAQFVGHVHDLTGIWPIIYMNGSTRNAYDWSPVTNNCGVWIAWYGKSPEEQLPVTGSYIAHQYSSTGSVPGIAGNVDMDAWFIDVETLKKYGYHATVPTPQPVSEPTPAPAPVVDPVPIDPSPVPAAPAPDPTPAPTDTPPQPAPVVTPDPAPVPTESPAPTPVVVTTKRLTWWQRVLEFLQKVLIG